MSKCWILQSNDEGRISMTEWQRANFHDYALKHPKQQYKLEPLESTRTMQQNKLYWLYLGVICRETGNDSPEDLHEFFKQKFLVPVISQIKGKQSTHEVKRYPSTTTMKKVEFSDYMTKIEALTGIMIPDTEAHNAHLDTAPLLNE